MATLSIIGGSRTTNTNLTTTGTSDYKIEHPTMGNYVTKSGGSGAFGTYSFTGSTAYTGSNFDSPLTVSWTDGTPTASGTSNNSRYSYGTIVIPVSLGTGTIDVYVDTGAETGDGLRCSAVLSDGSATASPVDLAGGGSKRYQITAAAGSAGQTLTITLQNLNGGYAWLRGSMLVAGGGPTPVDYVITPDGGTVFSGASNVSTEKAVIPSGGVVFGGTAPVVLSKEYLINPSGGIVFSGGTEPVRERVFPVSGGVLFGGSAVTVHENVVVPVGGVAFGGDGSVVFTPNSSTTYDITPSGGVSFSGTSSTNREFAIVPVGSIVFSGASLVSREKVILPSGGVTFDGSANFQGDHIISPNGGIVFGGNGGMFFVPAGGGGGSGLWDISRLNVRVSKAIGL